ncbi:MAG: ABC-2 transporter permease [Oscillospiraceae bacterium]|nr:ABC-2 transporter permease [Oscillospiraceae bacterium]
MKGFLYKELVQNKLRLALTVLIALCTVFLPVLLVFIDEESFSKNAFSVFVNEGAILRYPLVVLGFLASWIITEWMPSGDRTKKWCYFAASTPSGISGYICSKYIFMALQSAMYFALCIGLSYLLKFICDSVGGYDIPSFAKLFVALYFIQLASIAVDFPFSVRFGERAGGIIKVAMYLSLTAIALLVLKNNPDGLLSGIEKLIKKLIAGDFPSYFKFILASGAVLLYALSGVLSRFLYLKGIEKHSK